MKMPKMPKVKFDMAAAFPADKAVKAGQAVLKTFAHHAPSVPRGNPRMDRPHGGKGPHN
jgi:hypothetical protein